MYTISQMNKIFTACGDGLIPFISADDIADVAFKALTDKESHNCDYKILGPELLTYDQVRETHNSLLQNPQLQLFHVYPCIWMRALPSHDA